jgi:hypothetical protein
MTVPELPTSLTTDEPMGKDGERSQRPSTDEIAMMAYRRYEMRGRRDGHDVEDWLAAEQELTQPYR